MNKGLIPSRYAKALYEFALKEQEEEIVYSIAKEMIRYFDEIGNLSLAFENPLLKKSRKREIVFQMTSGIKSKAFEKFVDLVLMNGREDLLYGIVLKYIDLYRERKNIISAKLTVASTIDIQTEKKLETQLETDTNGIIELEKIIDSDVIGGFVFEVDGSRWDASVSGQLNRLRHHLLSQNK